MCSKYFVSMAKLRAVKSFFTKSTEGFFLKELYKPSLNVYFVLRTTLFSGILSLYAKDTFSFYGEKA